MTSRNEPFRRGRESGYTEVENWAFDRVLTHFRNLPPAGKEGRLRAGEGLAVLTYLAERCNPFTGSWCYESLGTIADNLGFHRRKVQRILRELERCGVVKRGGKHGRTARYRPVYHKRGKQSASGLPQANQSAGRLNTQSAGGLRPSPNRPMASAKVSKPEASRIEDLLGVTSSRRNPDED